MFAAITFALALVSLSGCRDESAIASENTSKEANNFGIERRIVFFNGITGEYMLTIEGRCSINDQGNQLEVTCKTGDSMYKKHFLGLSDNVSYMAEQVEAKKVSGFHSKVNFRPESILPDIDIKTSGNAVVPLGDKVTH